MREEYMSFEKEFVSSLFRNAIIFIDSAIGFINKGLADYVNMVQAVVNLQVAMELALKSSVASKYGIKTILVSRQSQMTDAEIEQLFLENKLKTREFDDIKNFTKGQGNLYDFERTEYKYMDMFQKYRNCVLHSLYVFSEEEKQGIERDVIYTLIHILGVLMSDETDTEERTFMQEYLNNHEYAKLLNNRIYGKELNDFLRQEYDELYICPYCSTKTMTEDYKCARCFNVFSDPYFYKYVKCHYCGKNMVICDAANIDCNEDHMVRGLCLNCNNDTIVYKCPKCGSFVNAEAFDRENCHEGFCVVFDE